MSVGMVEEILDHLHASHSWVIGCEETEAIHRLDWSAAVGVPSCFAEHVIGGGFIAHARQVAANPDRIGITARIRMALAEAGYTKYSYVSGNKDVATIHPVCEGRMEIPGWTVWLATVTAKGVGASVDCYTCWANQRVCPTPKPYVPGRSLLDDCEPPLGQGTSIDHLRWDGCLDD
jgi:hypothetical protein